MDVDEKFSKYMEMIQDIIKRMAKNSFQIKTWSATLFVATIVLTYAIINIVIFGVLIFAIILLWGLDSYYLKQERLFRKLYEDRVNKYNNNKEELEKLLYDMDLGPFIKKVDSVPKTMISISELLFYISIVLTLITFLVSYIFLNWESLISL